MYQLNCAAKCDNYSLDIKIRFNTDLIILIIPREPAIARMGSPDSKVNDHAAV